MNSTAALHPFRGNGLVRLLAILAVTLNMRGATPETGTATLQFCRQTASPGIGADARIKAEIEKTLTQFSNITKVVILLNNGQCFGDMSGADLCLR